MMAQSAPSAIATRPAKTFQYQGHHRPDYKYSPFHQGLDASLKTFYGKANLQTVLLKKGLLDFQNLYLLDHAIIDVWPAVVFVRIPKWVPSQNPSLFQKAEQHFVRFISKKDFLEAVVDHAMLQGNQTIAHPCRNDSSKLVVKSAVSGEFYELTPTSSSCSCSCRAHQSLDGAFSEDSKMAALLVAHPMLQGQTPDKHIFSLWKTWTAATFTEYQLHQRQWAAKNACVVQHKTKLKQMGIALRQDIPGHFNVLHGAKILGSVDQRFDAQKVSWWINQRQISRLNKVPGDHVHYESIEEAAIALAKLCQVIEEGDKAVADLFGDWDTPAKTLSKIAEPSNPKTSTRTSNLEYGSAILDRSVVAPAEHLVEDHGEFLDETEDLRLASDFEPVMSEQRAASLTRWLTAADF